MERDASIEPFGFAMAVIGSTRRPTTANKLAVIALQHIMTPSFVSLDMFALVVPYVRVQPKISPSISHVSMYRKLFISRRNRTNSR